MCNFIVFQVLLIKSESDFINAPRAIGYRTFRVSKVYGNTEGDLVNCLFWWTLSFVLKLLQSTRICSFCVVSGRAIIYFLSNVKSVISYSYCNHREKERLVLQCSQYPAERFSHCYWCYRSIQFGKREKMMLNKSR